MQLGLCLAAFGDLSLPHALAQAAEFGVPSLDLPTDTTLRLVDARRCAADSSYLDDVAHLLSDNTAKLSVTCVSNSRDAQLLLGPHGPQTDPIMIGGAEEKRDHAVKCALGSIRLARRVGAQTVRLQLGCPDYSRWLTWAGSTVGWHDNVDEFFQRSTPILVTAREAGIRVLLEPHPKQIVYDRASANAVFEAGALWSDTLGLCLDPANLAATGHHPVEAVFDWNERLIAVHAKDLERWTRSGTPIGKGWCRYGPQPPIRFRTLGLGELNWAAITSALVDVEFSGVLYVEHEDALVPRRQSLHRSLATLRSLLPDGVAEGRTW